MKLNQTNRVNTPFGDFQIDVDNLVDHFFGDAKQRSRTNQGWSPRTVITESDTEYQVVMELAGVNPDDVSVEMKESQLVVAGEKPKAEAADGKKVLRDERVTGKFQRVFEFAVLVESEKISAEFKSGLLTLVLPKVEKVLPKKIQIKVAE